jgi:UDP-2,3-diacylglucosamine hydrolase
VTALVGDPGQRIGLIAGSGRLPAMFAAAAKERNVAVVAVGHRGETDPALEALVESLTWVRVGQVNKILSAFRAGGVSRAAMAGGIGKVRAITDARPDLGALKIVSRLRSLRDDALLREVAAYFEESGVTIVAPTEFLTRALAPQGLLAGPALSSQQQSDVTVGIEVARAIGRVDVGQTVVVRNGHVLAVEAIEGTDEAIRRAGRLGAKGAVVVKLAKPGQDERFDLPAVGPGTIEVMREAGAGALVVEASKTILLDAEKLFSGAMRDGISVLGLRVR